MIIYRIICRLFPSYIIGKSNLFDKQWYSETYDVSVKHAASDYLKYGYKKGYNPSKYFSTINYHQANPDTKTMNPLLHYEVWGRSENRILSANTTPNVVVNDKNEISVISRPVFSYVNSDKKDIKTCAIFASYCNDEIIPDYVIYYLSELKKEVDSIVFVADNNLKNPKEINKIRGYVDYACFDRHGAYDFGSYKRGIQYLKENNLLENIEELYLVNDSCYGPIDSFHNVIETMRNKKCDFWGLLDSNDIRYHLQSFFYCFKNNVINDPIFYSFFDNIHAPIDFSYAVFHLETELTKYLETKYRCECYFHGYVEKHEYQSVSGNENSTLWPLSLLESGFPLVKVKALNGSFGKDLHENIDETLQYIKKKNEKLYQIIVEDIERRIGEDNLINLTCLDKLSEKKIISFDIFDTLLLRPFSKPTTLFEYIERKYSEKGFARERIDAERRARLASKSSEVTLKEIYNAMQPKYARFQEIEMLEEEDLLIPNPRILDLYNYAVKNNKKIIAISDMYLNSTFLSSVLKKNGFNEISKVYVSCEENKTKANGLFSKVLKDLDCKAEDIIHIGDNYESDIKGANSNNIEAYHVEKYVDAFLNMSAKYKYAQFYHDVRNLESSAYIFLMARKINESKSINDFNDFGYSIGGPLVVSYLSHICKQAKENDVDELLFVARDGYILKKVYDKYFCEKLKIKSEYVYLTRAVALGATLDFSKADIYLKYILKLASLSNKKIGYYDDFNVNMEIYTKNKKWLKEWSKKNRQNLEKHIFEISGDFKHIGIVDGITSAFTASECVRSILKDRFRMGFCIASYFNNTTVPNYSFCGHYIVAQDDDKIILMEKILSSPENAIIGINEEGEPIYKEAINDREYIYKNICDGVLEYVDNYFKYLKSDEFNMSFDTWLKLADNYLKYMNPIDEKMLEKIEYSKDTI